ncbi:hypothetical protein PJL18_03795 [Paenarthrobacter nicotinovorans]|nr:hypothetical protein [Paenarthrobacter nicotinovorans]
MSILKRMGCPALTLISVEKPWIVSSPAPSMSHSEGGLPGLEFSHATAFTMGSQGPAATAAGAVRGSNAATIASTKVKSSPLRAR